MTVGKLLFLGVGGLTALAFGMAACAFLSTESLNREIEIVTRNTGRKLALVGDIEAGVLTARTANRGVMLFSSVDEKESADRAEASFQAAHARLDAEISDLRGLLSDEAGLALLAEIESNLAQYTDNHRNILAMCRQGKTAEAVKKDAGVGVTLGTAMSKAADKMKARQVESNEQSLARSLQIRSRSRWLFGSLFCTCLLLGAVTGFQLTAAVRRLQKQFAVLAGSSDRIHEVSQRVSSSGQSAAACASSNAAALEETSASTSEISLMTQRGKADADAAAELINRAGADVEGANQAIAEMETSMQAIDSSSP